MYSTKQNKVTHKTKQGNSQIKQGNSQIKQGNSQIKQGNSQIKLGNSQIKQGNSLGSKSFSISLTSLYCVCFRWNWLNDEQLLYFDLFHCHHFCCGEKNIFFKKFPHTFDKLCTCHKTQRPLWPYGRILLGWILCLKYQRLQACTYFMQFYLSHAVPKEHEIPYQVNENTNIEKYWHWIWGKTDQYG